MSTDIKEFIGWQERPDEQTGKMSLKAVFSLNTPETFVMMTMKRGDPGKTVTMTELVCDEEFLERTLKIQGMKEAQPVIYNFFEQAWKARPGLDRKSGPT